MIRLTRRRVLSICAAAAATGLSSATARAAEARWRGVALGSAAEVRLRHLSQEEAAPLFADLEAELARLGAIFSLYLSDSAIARLNARGALDSPPPELVELLTLARGVHGGTEGLFDPTVQPLFRLYAEAAVAGARVGAPELSVALDRVGMEHVAIGSGRIAFARPGVALTLNGIAQGYITDRIAALLRRAGMRDMIVDMGEIVAIGDDGSGLSGWRVRLAGGAGRLQLGDRAVATSAPLGTRIDPAGRIGHILHPRAGWIFPPQRQVSVVADSAALADALSTAATLMSDRQIAALRRRGITLIALPA